MADWNCSLREIPLGSCTLGSLALHLRELLPRIPFSHLGKVAEALSLITHWDFGKLQSEVLPPDNDLLPLPMIKLSAEDLTNCYQERKKKVRQVTQEYWSSTTSTPASRSFRLSCVHAWVFCMVTLLNHMHSGFGSDQHHLTTTAAPPTPAQVEALVRLHFDADDFIGDNKRTLKLRDWNELLDSRRLTYDGEVVAKAQTLTLPQVLPALPPVGIAATVDAVQLVDSRLGERLLHPELSVKPRNEWPEKLSTARMRISREDWLLLAEELLKRKICRAILPKDMIQHNGRYLTNGIFGVGKGKFITCPKTQQQLELLRLIINLVPSNELQEIIKGDVDTLPHFGQWLSLELLSDEILVWGSEDISCAFYVFALPDAWGPYFVLHWPVPGSLAGMPEELEVYLTLAVIPMGWTSAVGICQHCMRRLNALPAPLGAKLPAQAELRKDRSQPVDWELRILRFFQQFIDNWDSGTAVKESLYRGNKVTGPLPNWVEQWRAQLVKAYSEWNVPRAADKSTAGTQGQTLGGAIAGVKGKIWPGEDKIHDIITLLLHLLVQPVPKRKQVSAGAGKLVFLYQFKRALMILLNHVWDVISEKVSALERAFLIREEFVGALLTLPLLYMDLRAPTVSLVTCSDASEEGGGVCFSSRITSRGTARVGLAQRATKGGRTPTLGLLELFSGISGARRALELLGITPAVHVHAETDPAAQRVCTNMYPDAISLGDVTTITDASFGEALKDTMEVTHWLEVSGPPCQNVSGLNASRSGVTGKQSSLAMEVPRIRKVLASCFPSASVGHLMENVATMSETDQLWYNKLNGRLPVRICPGTFTYVRRPRLYWLSWPLRSGQGVIRDEAPRWTNLQLTVPRASKMPLERWLPRRWRCLDNNPLFPTFVRAIARSEPPWMPAGIASCTEADLARYKAHNYAYPPYQYKPSYLVRGPDGREQPPTSEMREVLMGFERDHTVNCWSAADRRAHPKAFELARCSLIGNSFHAGVIAWLLSHQLAEWGFLSRPISVREVADPGIAANLYDDEQVPAEPLETVAPVMLVRHYISRQSHRGGDVSHISNIRHVHSAIPQAIDPTEWHWKTCISTRWRIQGEHINTLECRAYLLALRWRIKSVENSGTRFLHLVDSNVTRGVCVKGRTSSKMLRRVLAKINATILAAHIVPHLGFVRTHRNPADRPSRALKSNNATVKKSSTGLKGTPPSSANPRAVSRPRQGE